MIKEVKGVLNDGGLLRRFSEKINKKPGVSFTLERYNQCKNHGILLFESNGKLSQFLRKYIEDLNSLTGEYLNIYFTDSDLKKDVSAYERIKKFTYLKVKENQIPCFLVWESNKLENDDIQLEGLSHEEIFKVIKKFKIALTENKTFKESVLLAKQEVEEIKASKQAITYAIIDSNVGAVGNGAVAIDTKFN